MSILFLILPITLLLSAAAALTFAWATRSGQFDDLETPALRMLDDETKPGAVALPKLPPGIGARPRG
jgi:cbb3-type cytochrome oxidase maturation protein